MSKAILAALAALAALALWASVASVVLATALPTGEQDDVQTRTYRDGWSVVIRAPKLGDYPEVSTFEIDPTPAYDLERIGPYVVDIEWGAGPNGEPVVTISLIGEGGK